MNSRPLALSSSSSAPRYAVIKEPRLDSRQPRSCARQRAFCAGALGRATRARARGGIQTSGSLLSQSCVRSQRASSLSVLARRLLPRSALVSTDSARCASWYPPRRRASRTIIHLVPASDLDIQLRHPRNRPRPAATRPPPWPSIAHVHLAQLPLKRVKVICAQSHSEHSFDRLGSPLPLRTALANRRSRRAWRRPPPLSREVTAGLSGRPRFRFHAKQQSASAVRGRSRRARGARFARTGLRGSAASPCRGGDRTAYSLPGPQPN